MKRNFNFYLSNSIWEMKFSGRRTYTRLFSFLPILFVLAHGLGSVFCIRQKAGTQKLISEGLTKEPRTGS